MQRPVRLDLIVFHTAVGMTNALEAVAAAGYDAARFGGHSLRAGFATAAARAGVPEAQIMAQTGHRSLPVLRGYIRRGSLFTDNAAAKVGL